MMASDDNLVPRKEATSILLNFLASQTSEHNTKEYFSWQK